MEHAHALHHLAPHPPAPEYRDPLLQHIGEREQKSLLILDEAHVAAPASASRYAVDSKITSVVRDIVPRSESRLFLSAAPHNGHSNSFSALLELLDPQRFTRGVPVRGHAQLEAVMVRRLKEDLRQLGVEQFPKRALVQIKVGDASSKELVIAKKLAAYTALVNSSKSEGRRDLVFINLQKHLLSSVEAFYRTLQAHHRAVMEGRAGAAPPISLPEHEGQDRARRCLRRRRADGREGASGGQAHDERTAPRRLDVRPAEARRLLRPADSDTRTAMGQPPRQVRDRR